MTDKTIHAVTCRTPDCDGENWTLTLINPGDEVVCGGCSQQITDIQPPLPVREPVPDEETEGIE